MKYELMTKEELIKKLTNRDKKEIILDFIKIGGTLLILIVLLFGIMLKLNGG